MTYRQSRRRIQVKLCAEQIFGCQLTTEVRCRCGICGRREQMHPTCQTAAIFGQFNCRAIDSRLVEKVFTYEELLWSNTGIMQFSENHLVCREKVVKVCRHFERWAYCVYIGYQTTLLRNQLLPTAHVVFLVPWEPRIFSR